MSHGECCIVMCAYSVLVTCDVVWLCSSAICFDVLGCAVMHGVLSAMWHCVESFAEMSHGECCTGMCAYCVLVRCDVVWCAVLCWDGLICDVL